MNSKRNNLVVCFSHFVELFAWEAFAEARELLLPKAARLTTSSNCESTYVSKRNLTAWEKISTPKTGFLSQPQSGSVIMAARIPPLRQKPSLFRLTAVVCLSCHFSTQFAPRVAMCSTSSILCVTSKSTTGTQTPGRISRSGTSSS